MSFFHLFVCLFLLLVNLFLLGYEGFIIFLVAYQLVS